MPYVIRRQSTTFGPVYLTGYGSARLGRPASDGHLVTGRERVAQWDRDRARAVRLSLSDARATLAQLGGPEGTFTIECTPLGDIGPSLAYPCGHPYTFDGDCPVCARLQAAEYARDDARAACPHAGDTFHADDCATCTPATPETRTEAME
jgi:hypothetical protein